MTGPSENQGAPLFPKGTRVKLNKLYLKGSSEAWQERLEVKRGTVVAQARSGSVCRAVHWDGTSEKSTGMYHEDFLEATDD